MKQGIVSAVFVWLFCVSTVQAGVYYRAEGFVVGQEPIQLLGFFYDKQPLPKKPKAWYGRKGAEPFKKRPPGWSVSVDTDQAAEVLANILFPDLAKMGIKEMPPEQAEGDMVSELMKLAVKKKLSLSLTAIPGANLKAIRERLLTNATLSPDSLKSIPGSAGLILVGIVDRYGTHTKHIGVYKPKDGDYRGRRSVLQIKKLMTAETGNRKVAAATLYLYSKKDGRLLWQGNEADSIQHIFTSKQSGAARKILKKMVKNLQKAPKKKKKKRSKGS